MEAKFLIGTICLHSWTKLAYEIETEVSAKQLIEAIISKPIGDATRTRERALSYVEMNGKTLPKSTEVFYIEYDGFRVYIMPPIIGDRPKYTLQDLEDLKNNHNISK